MRQAHECQVVAAALLPSGGMSFTLSRVLGIDLITRINAAVIIVGFSLR